MTACTTNVREAAKALRRAMRAHYADPTQALGRVVADAAFALDIALAATEPAGDDVNKARDAWNEVAAGKGLVEDAFRAALEAVSFPALKAAALRLYTAGKWRCARPVNEALLWEELRDALGLRPGTATRAGIHNDEPPLPFGDLRPQCTVPPEGWRCTRGQGHEGPCAAVPNGAEPSALPVPEAGPRIATSPIREVAEASVTPRPGAEL